MRNKVKLPAIGLIVVGILGLILGLIGLAGSAVDASRLVDSGMDPEMADQLVRAFEGGGVAMRVVALAASAFLVWAGFQMMNLKGWTAAVIANIMAMVPCWGCCLIGIPIGIWGLVVLFNSEVKAAFKAGGE